MTRRNFQKFQKLYCDNCPITLTFRRLMSYIYIYGAPILDVSRSHTTTHHSRLGLLWTSDQLVSETSTWQHTTLTTDKYPCPRWDSNPRSQQASGLWLNCICSLCFTRNCGDWRCQGWVGKRFPLSLDNGRSSHVHVNQRLHTEFRAPVMYGK